MTNVNKIIKKELLEFKKDIGSTLLILIMAIVMIAGMMVFFAYDFSKNSSSDAYTAYIEGYNKELTTLLSTSPTVSITTKKDEADLIVGANDKDIALKYNSNKYQSIGAAEEVTALIEAYNNQVLEAELEANKINKPTAYITASLTDIKAADEDQMSIGDAIIKILLPMAILFFLPLIIMTPASSIIATEKDSKTLESTLLLPVSRKEIISGKFLAVMLIGLVSLLMIIATFILTSNAINSFFDVEVSLRAKDYLGIFLAGLTYLMPVGAAGIIISLYAKNVKSAQIIGTVAFFIFAGLSQLPNILKNEAGLKFAPLVNNGLVLNQIANYDQNLDITSLVLAIIFNIIFALIFLGLANKMIRREKYIIPN